MLELEYSADYYTNYPIFIIYQLTIVKKNLKIVIFTKVLEIAANS